MAALDELERHYEKAKRDPKFQKRLDELLRTYAGRPTPLFFAQRLTKKLGGAKIYLKREDLLHTGAHKINNCLGQALLVERMGKRRIIAETGAGQHGVATATVCALFGFECVVYMGTEDMRRQELNVFRMRLLGAEVRGVNSGSRTLKDAINEAMRDWVTNVRTTHYLLGSVLGAAFIVLLPIFLDFVPRLLGTGLPVNVLTNLEAMIFGALIVFFLIVEPRGLARLWQIGKEKLRLWPFPH